MKVKVTKIEKSLKEGLHLVKITRCRYFRNSVGKISTNKNKENGLEVKFTDVNGQSWTELYWIGSASLWRIKKLVKECSPGNVKTINTKELIGKILWIAIGQVVILEHGVHTGEFELEIFRYIRYIPGMDRPAILGDPIKNNGVPSNRFIREYEKFEEVEEPESTDNLIGF